MKKHTKIYYDAFGYPYDPTFFVPSELSGNRAVDINHTVNREDRIENLMALTRNEHLEHGEIKSSMVMLLERHRSVLENNNIPFDNEWFEKWIRHYED